MNGSQTIPKLPFIYLEEPVNGSKSNRIVDFYWPPGFRRKPISGSIAEYVDKQMKRANQEIPVIPVHMVYRVTGARRQILEKILEARGYQIKTAYKDRPRFDMPFE